jgi:hypothetical protein
VQEVKPWLYQLTRTPAFAYNQMVPAAMGLLAWLWLGFAPGRTAGRRLDPLWLTSGLCLIVAAVALWSAIRAGAYVQWLAAPLIAAALGDLTVRYLKGQLIGVVALSLLLSPATLAKGATMAQAKVKAMTAAKKAKPKPAAKPAPPVAKPKAVAAARVAPKPKAPPGCFDIAAWTPLAGAPAGLALSEVDLGPFILAHTQLSVVRAPYHRMNFGILRGYEALAAPADGAAADKVRALGVAYVVECVSHRRQSDRDGMTPDSLQRRLDADKPPAWLETMIKTPTLTLYRVRPAGAATAG